MNIIKRLTFNPYIYSEEELCEIYRTFNHWEWPSILGSAPDIWNSVPKYYLNKLKDRFLQTKFKISRPIMNAIKEVVGDRKLLEYHWIHNLDRTKEEFEEWYCKKDSHSLNSYVVNIKL